MGKVKFRYYPNVYEDNVIAHVEGVCQCCGRTVNEYIESMYAVEDVDCICLQCVSDGSAAAKFHGSFIEDADPVSNPEKQDELFHRTPGYLSWQGEYWLACCDDYCKYMGYVGIKELEELGCKDEVLEEYVQRDTLIPIEDLEKYLHINGYMRGYLFQCLHCGKYHLWVDID